jgi:uncharacterized protein with von Willebrand factor type A (vWA) domain
VSGATTPGFGVETVMLDLPPLVGAFSRRLHDAGVPVTAERSAQLARALTLTEPVAWRRLYFIARAVLLTDPAQRPAFDRVFAEVFGVGAERIDASELPEISRRMVAPDERWGDVPPAPLQTTSRESADASPGLGAPPRSPDGREIAEFELPVPTVATDEEVLRAKRFDALAPDELARLYALMTRLTVATPRRLSRRRQRARHGARVDVRATMRASLRTGGDPIRLARRRRRRERRRLVLMCDISGSMEPYARAYLQFLTCAAGTAGPAGGSGRVENEAFVFATRLTRLTRALRSRYPERAIAQAAATAPDWSSGTRIGDALKVFNDRHGRRGMARGAVVVILSDGWERGDPMLVGRELQRLSRLAYRIVWVNPRAAAAGFQPRAGGMAAALPYCDALVSGHTLAALSGVVDAIAAERADDLAPGCPWRPPALPASGGDDDSEPWASATTVAGSSVAMPSGYGPSRGRTTEGWSLHG